MNTVSRGIRNAFRNVIRTVSIVIILGLSIGLSLTMLVAHQAVSDKINSVKASVGNTVTISPAGLRGFLGGGNPLTTANLNTVKSLPHVTSTVATLSDRLTSSDSNLKSAVRAGVLGRRFSRNSGISFRIPVGAGSKVHANPTGLGTAFDFSPPVAITGTNDPTNLSGNSVQGGGTFTITSGKVFMTNSNANVALIGTALARKNNLHVGSTFTAYNTTMTVLGIYNAGNAFANSQVIVPLSTEQRISGQSGELTSITLNVDSITNVNAVTTMAAKKLGSAADVTNAATEARNSITPLENIQSISLYSLIGAVVAGAVIILLTMIMIVRERRREIGVMKAIGASNITVMEQFMTEAITFTVLAAVMGIILGVIASNPITHLLVTSSTNSRGQGRFGLALAHSHGFGFIGNNLHAINAAIGWSIILYGLAAALIIAIVASGFTSFLITKIRPAEVMRSE